MLLRLSAALVALISFTSACSAQIGFYSSGGGWVGPRGWGYTGYGPSYSRPAGYYYSPAGYTYLAGPARYTAAPYANMPAAYTGGCPGPAPFRAGCVGAYTAGCPGNGNYKTPAPATETPKSQVDLRSPHETALAALEAKYAGTQTTPPTTPIAPTTVEVTVNGQKIEPKDGKIVIEIKTGPTIGATPPTGTPPAGLAGIADTFKVECKAATPEKGLASLTLLRAEARAQIQSPRIPDANALRQSLKASFTAVTAHTMAIPRTARAIGEHLAGAVPAGDVQLTPQHRAALLAKLEELIDALTEAVR